jgi:periodic tryptophan protein 1
MSMITATAWVPRGFAAPFPTKYNFDEEEFQRIAKLAKLQLDDANEELDDARARAEGDNGADAMIEEGGSDDEAPSKTLKSKGLVAMLDLCCALADRLCDLEMTTMT